MTWPACAQGVTFLSSGSLQPTALTTVNLAEADITRILRYLDAGWHELIAIWRQADPTTPTGSRCGAASLFELDRDELLEVLSPLLERADELDLFTFDDLNAAHQLVAAKVPNRLVVQVDPSDNRLQFGRVEGCPMRIRLVLLMSLLVAVPGSTSTDPAADPALDALGGTPRQIVAQTGQRTVQAGTARIAMETNTTAPLTSGTSKSEGVIDLREKTGQVKTKTRATVRGEYRDLVPDRMTSTLIFANGDLYIGLHDDFRRLGAPSGTVPGMKPWLRMTGAGPVAFGRYIGLDLSQPYLGLEQLRDAVSVTEVGRDRVRGAAVRHLHAEISVERHVASYSSPGGSAEYRKALVDHRKALLDAYHRAGISSLPVDVWVDGQGRARKLQSHIDYLKVSVAPPVPGPLSGPAQQVGSEGRVAWTVEFYDFGVPVHVEIPPADQVTDF